MPLGTDKPISDQEIVGYNHHPKTVKYIPPTGERDVAASKARSLLGVAMAIRGMDMASAARRCGIAPSSLEMIDQGHTFGLTDYAKSKVRKMFKYTAEELSQKPTMDSKLSVMMGTPIEKES